VDRLRSVPKVDVPRCPSQAQTTLEVHDASPVRPAIPARVQHLWESLAYDHATEREVPAAGLVRADSYSAGQSRFQSKSTLRPRSVAQKSLTLGRQTVPQIPKKPGLLKFGVSVCPGPQPSKIVISLGTVLGPL
jgi:hypothetical protein